MSFEPLQHHAQQWIDNDPDPQTRAAGQAILDAAEIDTLKDHFGGHLSFGTAGMRGALGPGPRRMNRAVVQRVGAGLARYVNRAVPQAAGRCAVVGYDARHGSRVFAEDTACVLAAAGFSVVLFEEVAPTPSLAHAVVFMKAAVGVMVTASHNPAGDNGYKVYWSDGAQIIPPHDSGIADAIDWQGPLPALPDLAALITQGTVAPMPTAGWEDYLARVLALRVHPGVGGLRAIYTAMHGVGGQTLQRLSLIHI